MSYKSNIFLQVLQEIKRSPLSDSMKNRDYRVFEDF